MRPSSPEEAMEKPDRRARLDILSSGALVGVGPARARVQVKGRDARGFLHRMSTQAVEALGPEEARLSVLTNRQGRIVDVVHHLTLAEDEVVLIGTKPDGAALVTWLDEFLFVEKVELFDLSAEGAIILVAGKGAPDVVEAMVAGAGALSPWAMVAAERRIVVRTFDLVTPAGEPIPSFLVWDREAEASALEKVAVGAGATEAEPDVLEAARVAAGVPAAEAEVSERYNPLELDLYDAIHWSKGCYIGQEVIARIDNYGKQARRLVGLVLDEEGRRRVRAGDGIDAAGKAAGEVTSVSPIFVEGLPSALAMLRHRGDVYGQVYGQKVRVVASDGTPVPATVVKRVAAQEPHD